MPWWTALLITVTATAIGYGIDAGHKELTHVFAGFYIAGCVAAVLAVRQDGIFTAIIQPPLILFCAVPGAYWLFHDGKVHHLKDLLINCGYPLIERFPLMLGTTGGVLLIGMLRWYLATSPPKTANAPADMATSGTGDAKSFVGDLVAKVRSLLSSESDEDVPYEAPSPDARRRRGPSSSPKDRRTARTGPSATRPARTHSRHARQSPDDPQEPVERPRRSSRRSSARDYDTAEPPRRSRRRPRPEADTDPHGQPLREHRREPRTRRSPYERPYEQTRPRSGRFDGYDMYGDRYDPPGPPERFGRFETRDRYEPPYETRRRRATPNGDNPTHHPISQVRYRGAALPDEPRAERRSRPRTDGHGRPPAKPWEYDG